MIPAPKVPEPAGFDKAARKAGNEWLAAHPEATRPKPLWIPFTPHLSEAYKGLCAYAAMFDPTGGTVDHYLSFRNHRRLAYEWTNYRFASATMNACKRTADHAVLDPQEVQDGWFEVLLPSLQMRLTDRVPPALREKAAFTLKRLQLDNGERAVRWRQSWYSLYIQGGLTLDGLREVAPLLAAAVERQANRAKKPK